MIKKSKNLTVKTAVGCSALTAILLLNGIQVCAADSSLESAQVSSVNQMEDESKNEFLIDAPSKDYYKLDKVQKYAGFDFKLPSSIESSEWIGDISNYSLVKLSDTSNAVVVNYNYDREKADKYIDDCKDIYRTGMKLLIFKDDPSQVIKKKYMSDDYENPEYKIEENEKTYGKINGKEVTEEKKITAYDGSANKIVNKFFIWQDDSVYYALHYYNISFDARDGQNFEINKCFISINENEINNIVNSFKDVDSITEINYKNDDSKHIIDRIYDNDDLIEADALLGFKAKVPNTFSNKNVKIQWSNLIDLFDDPNGYRYLLDLFYNNESEKITYTQSMHDYNDLYSHAENGANESTTNNETIEKIDVNGQKVYKCIVNDATGAYIVYCWKDNGVYNYLHIGTDYGKPFLGYEDDIAKEFVNYGL